MGRSGGFSPEFTPWEVNLEDRRLVKYALAVYSYREVVGDIDVVLLAESLDGFVGTVKYVEAVDSRRLEAE